jgi:hypothetical protein
MSTLQEDTLQNICENALQMNVYSLSMQGISLSIHNSFHLEDMNVKIVI